MFWGNPRNLPYISTTVEPLLKDFLNWGNLWSKDKEFCSKQVHLSVLLPLKKENFYLYIACKNLWSNCVRYREVSVCNSLNQSTELVVVVFTTANCCGVSVTVLNKYGRATGLVWWYWIDLWRKQVMLPWLIVNAWYCMVLNESV